jgi:hypothetical protein
MLTNTSSIKSVQNMHDDLAILWSAIKEMHAGYGIYTSTDKMREIRLSKNDHC